MFFSFSFVCLKFYYYPYNIRNIQGDQDSFTVYLKMGRELVKKYWIDRNDAGT